MGQGGEGRWSQAGTGTCRSVQREALSASRAPARIPHPAPALGPEPRSYSRALRALRAHDEAELVDAAFGEAVGLRVRAERAEFVGGCGVGARGQALPGPRQTPFGRGRVRPVLSTALRHPGRARRLSPSGHLSHLSRLSLRAAADAADAPPTRRAHWPPQGQGRGPRPSRELPPTPNGRRGPQGPPTSLRLAPTYST